MAMTNEEIDAEIARLTALKEQNNQSQAAENNKPADGVYNPADYIGQITNKMNEAGYTDEQGNKKSYGRGDKFSKNLDVAKGAGRRTGFEKDRDGTPLPETAYEWITQQLNEARARGPISKYTLRAIENGAKVRYNVPSKFDISGKGWIGNTDAAMARAMNSMSYNGKAQQPAQAPQQPAQVQQPVTEQTQQPVAEQPAVKKEQEKPVSPKTQLDDARREAYTRIKNKQASDADLDLFKNYTEEQLQKIGFGPISIKAIKERNTQSTASGKAQQAIEEKSLDPSTGKKPEGGNSNFLNTGGFGARPEKQPKDKKVNKLSDDEMQFMQQYNKAAGSRKPKDRAFLTPENVKKYNDLAHKQNAVQDSSVE